MKGRTSHPYSHHCNCISDRSSSSCCRNAMRGLEFVGIAGRNGRWYGIILSGLDCNEMIEI